MRISDWSSDVCSSDLFARGKIGRCPEADLVERYVKRIGWPLRITELPDRGGKLPPPSSGAVTVMLDEKGEQLSSMEFARKLEAWRDQGVRECRFLLGAADGFAEAERDRKSVGSGKGVIGRLDVGGRRLRKKQQLHKKQP